jgi:hypothetical protein
MKYGCTKNPVMSNLFFGSNTSSLLIKSLNFESDTSVTSASNESAHSSFVTVFGVLPPKYGLPVDISYNIIPNDLAVEIIEYEKR